jgi:hypothetical protein
MRNKRDNYLISLIYDLVISDGQITFLSKFFNIINNIIKIFNIIN